MSVGTYSLAREGDKLLSPHFRVREFACRDGADLVKIDTDLVELLERIRTAACGAVTVNSGYRTASYNQKVGGARASQHLLGRAADIQVSGASPLLVGQIAEYYLGGHGGIGVYQTFTHVDTRTARARWDQRSGREVAVSGWPGWRPKEETIMDNIPSAYAEEAVAWAVENGITDGVGGGHFDPNSTCTRAQIATFLRRAMAEYIKQLPDHLFAGIIPQQAKDSAADGQQHRPPRCSLFATGNSVRHSHADHSGPVLRRFFLRWRFIL